MKTSWRKPEDRFMRFLSFIKTVPSGCWEFGGSVSPNGYGRYDKEYAHRKMWSLYSDAPVPKGFDVMHSCDNRSCCNPAHLSIGTRKDNMQDCKRKGRNSSPPVNPGETHNTAKLTETDVIAIRARVVKGTSDEIAAHYGVRRQSINDILSHKTWKHI